MLTTSTSGGCASRVEHRTLARMDRGRWALLLMLSCTQARDLPRPAWVRTLSKASCGAEVALDAHQQLWSGGGCENGPTALWSRHRVTDAAAQRLHAAFEPLTSGFECPPVFDESGAPLFSEVTYWLFTGGDVRNWSWCETDGGAPFVTLDAAFDAL